MTINAWNDAGAWPFKEWFFVAGPAIQTGTDAITIVVNVLA